VSTLPIEDDDPLILVCMPILRGHLFMPDNASGCCAECGIAVQYRPHAPTPHVLRCVDCAIKEMKAGDEMLTTPKMLQDWHAYVLKRSN
jgi:hypothetical protein